MKIGYYQFMPVFGKIQQNLKKILSTLDGVDADLIVLPELSLTGYYFESHKEAFELAENVSDSSCISALIELSKKNNFYLVVGFAEKYLDKCFNSSALIGPEGLIHVYRKLHLFNTEKNCFDPGDTPLKTHSVKGASIGMMICFDWAFPEVARTFTLQGVDIICHPSNLVLDKCQAAMITRCIENRVYAVTANRYGSDIRPAGTFHFTGQSQIVSPGGEVIHRSVSQEEDLIIQEIDIQTARDKMITSYNDLIADRRVDYYKL